MYNNHSFVGIPDICVGSTAVIMGMLSFYSFMVIILVISWTGKLGSFWKKSLVKNKLGLVNGISMNMNLQVK
jgi:hypothetical protein